MCYVFIGLRGRPTILNVGRAQVLDVVTESPEPSAEQPLGEAVLKVGLESFPVMLVDQSESGFVVEAQQQPDAHEGQTLWLHTESGWAEVQVGVLVAHGRGVRVELQRVEQRDEDDDEEDTGPSLLGLAWKALHDSRVRIVLMCLIAASVACVELRHGRVNFHRVLGMIPFLQQGPEEPDDWTQQSVETAVKKEGAAAFLAPPLAEALGLSGSQRKRIGIIAARTKRTVEMATAGGSSEEYLEQVQIESHRKALAVLSDSQRRRWKHWLRLAEDELRQKRESGGRSDP